ncbi:hypothetical protein OAC51_03880 [Flavobacteriaceae bacterium]|nr:hypothetical protein [Flavobacteriaceae bacterium]
MGFDQYLVELSESFTLKINLFLRVLHGRMAPIIAVLVLIYIASKVLSYFSNLEKGLDPWVIVKPCVILAIIILYGPLIDFVLIKPTTFINRIVQHSIIDVSGGDITAFKSNFRSAMSATDTNTFTALQINETLEFVHLIIYFIASFIANYMLLRQVINLAIYHVFGYFSLMFSLIPGNENSFKTWVLSYLAILLWAPFIFLIKYLAILTKIGVESFQSFVAVVAIQISLIFLFFKVPAFCEGLVNTGNPNQSPTADSPMSGLGSVAGGLKKGVQGMAKIARTVKSKKR